MPMSTPLSRNDQRRFIGFGVGVLVVMTLVAWLSSSQEDQGEGAPSSYSVQRRGAKAAYLLLEKSGYAVERWKQAPAQLPTEAAGVTLVLAGPESFPPKEDMGGIVRFLMRGGRVLIAGTNPEWFVPQAESEPGEMRVGFTECKPAAPTELTRGGAISQDGYLAWDAHREAALVHFKDQNDKAVVVSYNLRQGRVIWWASALPLTNVGIGDRHNLDLLLNSIGDSRRILWDEYYHEEHTAATAHAANPAQMWALVQAAFLGLLIVLTFSRRSGPVIPLARESRLSPLEFVETLGSVFHRAHGTQVAVEIAFSRFQQVAARRLGIRGNSNASDILSAMAKRGLKAPEDVAAVVAGTHDAVADTELTEKQALEHVRALSDATAVLEPGVGAK